MDCSQFERILAYFAEGELSARDKAAAERHLENCPACHRLLSTARGETVLLPEDAADELAQSILDRTSGSVCPRVESRLWDFSTGELSEVDSRLVTLHLDHCPSCKSLAAAVAEALQVLPAIAEIEPDESFTNEVVWATSRSRPYRVDAWTYFLSWLDRMIKRPHFALETAYVGTLVLVFVFSSPLLPFWNRAFNRISSDVLQPSAQYLTSAWTAATSPVSAGLRGTVSAVTSNSRIVSGSLSTMRATFEQVPGRLGREVGNFQRWSRKEAAASFLALSARMSDFLRQSRT